MNSKIKKESFPCDYCHIEKDGKDIYTARKLFAGCKIGEILLTVTRRTIPTNAPINLCSLCASTLHAAGGIIAKAEEMVAKLLPNSNKPIAAIGLETTTTAAAAEEKISISIEPKPKVAKILKKQKCVSKELEVEASTPSKSQVPVKEQKAKIIPQTNGSPQKTPQNRASLTSGPGILDQSLENAVKLTPAKKHKDITQLFGPSSEPLSDSEEDEDENVNESALAKIKSNSNDTGFECKLCDFTCPQSVVMKRHLKEMHGKQRPRVFNCTQCPKTFGVLKTQQAHILTHKEKEASPRLAVLTALQPKPKPDYSFAVNATNSSTPRPAGEDGIKENLTTVQMVDRPKAFKCEVCDATYTRKQNVDRHMKVKHSGVDPATTKIRERHNSTDTPAKLPKITKRRKTVALEKIGKEQSPVKVAKKSPKTIEKVVEETVDEPVKDSLDNTIEELLGDQLDSIPNPALPKVCTKLFDTSAVSPKKKKSPAQLLIESFKSSDIPQAITNGSPKKTKRKSEETPENPPDIKLSNSTQASNIGEIIDLDEEVNINVKPHKRAKLDSLTMSESELSCSMCSKVVSSRKRLDSHLHKHHGSQLKCPNCKNCFATKMEYISHFTSCDASDGLPCGIHKCLKVFQAANYLSSHLNKKHKKF